MISDEAIEAAAEAINKFAAKYVGVLDPVPLNDMSWLDREHALGEARAALEAAAPFIAAATLDEAADRAEERELDHITPRALRRRAKSYRPTSAD